MFCYLGMNMVTFFVVRIRTIESFMEHSYEKPHCLFLLHLLWVEIFLFYYAWRIFDG